MTPKRSAAGTVALVVSVLVVAAASLGLAGVGTKAAEAHEYVYTLKPGTQRVYQMSSKATITPKGIPGLTGAITETTTGKMTMNVVEAKDDGSLLVGFKLADVKATGLQGGAVPDTSFRMRMSESGQVLSIDGPGIGGIDLTELFGAGQQQREGASFGSSGLFPSFPEDIEIAPGDTWTDEEDVPVPFGDDTIHVTVRGKHLGFVDSTYGRAARMNIKTSSPLDISFSFAEIFVAIAKAAGESAEIPAELKQARMSMKGLVRGDMTARVLPEDADPVVIVSIQKMNMTMRVEGLPAEAAAGFPADLGMAGTVVTKLSRVA